MPKRVPDEFTLLCESCGYEIEGLSHDAACPECGRAVSKSLPLARSGTPWQRHPRPASLWCTWTTVLTRPAASFSMARTGAGDSRRLLDLSLTVASAIVPLALASKTALANLLVARRVSARHPTPVTREPSDAFLFVVGCIVLFFGSWCLLAFLTFIEERGIRFWGPRRGWRITPTIAKIICAHASVGWVLGSVLAVLGHIIGLVLLEYTNRHNVGIFRGPMQLAPITLPALGLIAGMLTFEILVYIGMGRMKFANRERPLPDASRPAAAMPSPPTEHSTHGSARPD